MRRTALWMTARTKKEKERPRRRQGTTTQMADWGKGRMQRRVSVEELERSFISEEELVTVGRGRMGRGEDLRRWWGLE